MRALLSLLLLSSAAVSLAEPLEVALMPAKIIPEQVSVLTLDAGVLSDWADASQHQERGAVIAVLNKGRTAQEYEEMELQLAQECINAKDEIRKLQARRSKLEFYLKLNNKERDFARAAGGIDEDTPLTAEALRDIDERLELQHRRLESGPRLKRNEFERSHEKLTLKMPFSGRLQYHVSLPENAQQGFDFTPAPGQPFATVCDDSAFYITVNLSRADLTQLPPERLSVSISLPEGKKLTATYDKHRVEHGGAGTGDMLVYFFRIAAQDHETAFSMLGSRAQAHLVYDAAPGTLAVNKAELALRPESADCANWEELVSRIYPDHVIVIIGERTILLRPKS